MSALPRPTVDYLALKRPGDDDTPFTFEAALAHRDELRSLERELDLWQGRRPEVQTYTGGATAEEKRARWRQCNPLGPSGRTAAPEAFALYWLYRHLGDQADAAFDDAGAAKPWRDAVFANFDLELAEAARMVAAGNLFDQQTLLEFIHSRLPGMAALAETPRELAQVVAVLREMQHLRAAVPAGPVRGGLDEA